MANNALALGITPFKMPDPNDLQNNQMQRVNALMGMAKQRKAMQQEAAMTAAAQEAYDPTTGKLDGLKYRNALSQNGLAGQIPDAIKQEQDLVKGDLANKTAQTGIDKAELDNQITATTQVVQNLGSFDSPEQAQQWAASFKAEHPYAAAGVDRVLASMPTDPAQFLAWKPKQLTRAVSALDQAKKYRMSIDQGDKIAVVEGNELGGGTPTTIGTFGKTASPDTVWQTQHAPGQVFQTTQTDADGTTSTQSWIIRPDGTAGRLDADENGALYAGGQPVTSGQPNGSGPGGGGRNPYDVVLGNGRYGTPEIPVSQMTMGQAYDFGRKVLIPNTRGKVGAGPDMGSSALGAYQIVGTTLARYAERMFGPNWRNLKFTADVQDRLGQAIYEDAQRMGTNLSKVWTSLSPQQAQQMKGMPWSQAKDVISQGESGARVSQFQGGGGGRPTNLTPIGGKPAGGAKATKEETEKASKQANGRRAASGVIQEMRGLLTEMANNGATSSENNGLLENLAIGVGNSGVGQYFGRAAGTRNQTLRDQMAPLKLRMLNAIVAATGMGSKSIDSNTELKTWLDSIDNPQYSYEARMANLKNLENYIITVGGGTPGQAGGITGGQAQPGRSDWNGGGAGKPSVSNW